MGEVNSGNQRKSYQCVAFSQFKDMFVDGG